jgi:hypothetical protein
MDSYRPGERLRASTQIIYNKVQNKILTDLRSPNLVCLTLAATAPPASAPAAPTGDIEAGNATSPPVRPHVHSMFSLLKRLLELPCVVRRGNGGLGWTPEILTTSSFSMDILTAQGQSPSPDAPTAESCKASGGGMGDRAWYYLASLAPLVVNAVLLALYAHVRVPLVIFRMD